jgi:hypothetical protein
MIHSRRMKILRWTAATALCLVALALPYRARARYLSLVAAVVHAPYAWFGRLSRLLLSRLGRGNPYGDIPYRG